MNFLRSEPHKPYTTSLYDNGVGDYTLFRFCTRLLHIRCQDIKRHYSKTLKVAIGLATLRERITFLFPGNLTQFKHHFVLQSLLLNFITIFPAAWPDLLNL